MKFVLMKFNAITSANSWTILGLHALQALQRHPYLDFLVLLGIDWEFDLFWSFDKRACLI